MGVKKVHIYEFSWLNMVYALLSKRGFEKSQSHGMEWDKLWTINKIIDPVCPRHHAVIEERGVFLTLTIQGIRNMKTVQLKSILQRGDLFEERKDFLDVLNTCTKIEIPAVGDSNMRNLKCVEVLQLERKGYYRCDVPFTRPSKPVLFATSDGRQQTVLK
ncbi:hypothetical protein Patl1_15315 [Pistacia atlantica]|nr:hypothetical protein Patl1_15315 [Pistacia atlantica]